MQGAQGQRQRLGQGQVLRRVLALQAPALLVVLLGLLVVPVLALVQPGAGAVAPGAGCGGVGGAGVEFPEFEDRVVLLTPRDPATFRAQQAADSLVPVLDVSTVQE